jgi:hypothetical protein
MQLLRDKIESCPLGNEASLKFVSLRSQVDSVGRGAPSRVKMNALRAPLTALHVSMREHSSFSLDSADAFIDAVIGPELPELERSPVLIDCAQIFPSINSTTASIIR